MGAHQGALVALDALGSVPGRDLHGGAPLLVLRGARGPGAVLQAVLHHGGHRQPLSLLPVHHGHHVLDKSGSRVGLGLVLGVQPALRDLHLMELVDAMVDGGAVHVHHRLALLLVIRLVDGVLHLRHRLVDGDHAGEGEEGGLKDGVGAAAQSQLPGDADGVDGIEPGVLFRQRPLHGGGQVLFQPRLVPGAVQQEGAALLQIAHHVVLVDVGGVVAGRKVCLGDQVGRADGRFPEPQVALGQAAGLLGVVDEVGLAVQVRGVADDLDGVLVGAHRAVGPHAPELRAGLPGGRGLDLRHRQGRVSHVVHDADGEIALGLRPLQILVHRQDLARGGVLRGEAVPAPHDGHGDAPLLVDRAHVLVQGLAHGAGLLGPVQHRDLPAGLGDGGEQMLRGEGPVQVDVDEAHLLPPGGEVVHSLPGGLGGRAHEDHHPLRVRRAVVVEEMVGAAGQLPDLRHVVLHRLRDGGELLVAGLPALEEDVRVHRGAPGGGVLRVQGMGPEGLQGVHVHQRAQGVVVQRLDLLDLVGGAEAIEKVEEGHPAVDGRQMGHRPQVHHLLGRGGGQEREAGLPHPHHVGVVPEDGQGVGGQGPGRHVEHARQHLPRDLVHVGDHQQQALGGRVGGGQGAGLEGAVDRAGGAALGLHLHHLHRLAEEVFLSVGRPLVHVFRHGRRRRDGEDPRHLRERVGDVGGRLIAVHQFNFALHTVSSLSDPGAPDALGKYPFIDCQSIISIVILLTVCVLVKLSCGILQDAQTPSWKTVQNLQWAPRRPPRDRELTFGPR